jgi:hypothetical protein
VIAIGWQSGTSSAVRLAPWIAAIRATPMTSPFRALPDSISISVSAHPDRPAGAGDPVGFRLGRDVDHVRLAVGVEVGQLAHRRRASGNETKGKRFGCMIATRSLRAPRICTFQLPCRLPPDRAAPCATCCAAVSPAPAPVAVALSGAGGAGDAQNNLPALGDSDSAEFNVGAERKLGDEIMREIRVDPDYIDDPLLLEYLVSVWDPLVVTAGASATSPPTSTSASPGSLPGPRPERQRLRPAGRLRRRAPRPDRHHCHPRRARLVLGHELSHVTQRHIARNITSASRRSLVSLAALILGLLAASRSKQPRRDQRRRRRHPGGDDAEPAQLLARHGARGRPDRLPGDGRGRLRARRHGPRCSRRWTTPTGSTTTAASPTCAATR